jgi:hypothetical protein
LGSGTRDSFTVGSQGTITGVLTAISLSHEILSGGGNPSTFDTLTNEGTINSVGTVADSGAVILQGGGGDVVLNSGTISGLSGIALKSNVATENIENSGTIEGSSGSAISSSQLQVVDTFPSVGIDIVNSASGLLTNASDNNAGIVGDAVLYFDDGAGTVSTINNQGAITGAGYVIQSASDTLDIVNSGTIHGGLFSEETVSIDNSGLWQASTNSLGGSDGLIIDGTASQITNSGRINAPIILDGLNSALKNHRQIYGDVTLGADDTLVNTGVIRGDVTLGASDTITDNLGKVIGTFVASSNDLFAYSGKFGQETITDFGNGDILQFAANDFGSFGSVMHHTHQVGADTVIRLDARIQSRSSASPSRASSLRISSSYESGEAAVQRKAQRGLTFKALSQTGIAWSAALRRRQPNDHAAVAVGRSAHGGQPVDHRGIEPDQSAAILVGLVLVPHRAERERSRDGVVRLDGDGDADHAAPHHRAVGDLPQMSRLLQRQVDLLLCQRTAIAALQSVDDLLPLRVQALIWLRRHGRA